jgi:hypothetical protein
MSSAFEMELWEARRPQSLAQLAAAGITRDMTRGRAWRRTTRGWFVPADTSSSPTQRILEAVPIVPAGGALAGWAAAYVLGVDQLDGLDPLTLAPLPLPVHLGRDVGRADHRGVRVIRERLPAADQQLWHGLPVTTPLRTLFDGARWAPDLVEAVVFLDQSAHALGLELRDLEAWCTPGARWPGITQLRAALALGDARSASTWESRLRVFYQRKAGLPRPLVNRPIFDLTENFLGTPDLLDPEAGLATEFDGQGHRQRRQHRADNHREEKLEGVNLTVCRVDSMDLGQPASLRERLRVRHTQGLRRDRRLDGWTLVEPEWWRRRRRAIRP